MIVFKDNTSLMNTELIFVILTQMLGGLCEAVNLPASKIFFKRHHATSRDILLLNLFVCLLIVISELYHNFLGPAAGVNSTYA